MKHLKLFSTLSIIFVIMITPTIEIFAQSDIEDVETEGINKEQRVDKFVIDNSITQSLEFKGKVTGWTIISGQAVPIILDVSGNADKVRHSWKITGIGLIKVEDRNVTFDLQGHTRGNQIHLKGTTSEFDSLKLHLNGFFAPVAGNDGSFALAFNRSVITNEQAHIRIPLILIGQVETNLIDDIVASVETDPTDTTNNLANLFS
jgi:hypothetical protein